MPITINGLDGNPMTTRDVDGSPSNFVNSFHRLSFSGNYTSGGDTLDFTQISGLIPSGSVPLQVALFSQNGSFNQYVAVQSGALNTWKLKIASAGGAEITGGAAYPAGVTSDVVEMQVTWRKLL
jgi:hypothetical protein